MIYKSSDAEERTFPALRGLNLKINKGRKVLILGPSGSGKSTLLNIIRGHIVPSHGEVFIDDLEITKNSLNEKKIWLHNNIGFVHQDPRKNIVEELTPKELLSIPLLKKTYNKKEIEKKIEETLATLDLSSIKDRKIENLSGGEKQRLAISLTILKEPILLIADEPTGHLSEIDRDLVMELINDFHKRFGFTFICVTHDPVLSKWFDDVIDIQDGLLKLKIKDINTDNKIPSFLPEDEYMLRIWNDFSFSIPKLLLNEGELKFWIKIDINTGEILISNLKPEIINPHYIGEVYLQNLSQFHIPIHLQGIVRPNSNYRVKRENSSIKLIPITE